jgi:antitoxin VapB
MLAENNLGGVILNSQHNFAWLTAGSTNGVDMGRENGAATLVVRNDGKKFVLANCIEMPRILAEEIFAEDFEPVEFAWEEEKASATFLTSRAAALLNKAGLVGSDLFIDAKTPIIESQIATCRYRLNEAEIERYKLLGKDAGEIIGNLIKSLVPGQIEQEIVRLTINALAVRGIRSVVTLVAADERLKKFRHPVPSEKRWEKTLMIVVCAKRGGLIVSLSRIVCVGKIPDQLRLRTNACASVNAKLLAGTKLGISGAELYKIADEAYSKEDFAGEINLHHQGGATGYKTRDWLAHPGSQEKVQINQAFAWNPSIAGTKTEETCISFADHTEIITTTPDFPQIAVEIDGCNYLSPDILSL